MSRSRGDGQDSGPSAPRPLNSQGRVSPTHLKGMQTFKGRHVLEASLRFTNFLDASCSCSANQQGDLLSRRPLSALLAIRRGWSSLPARPHPACLGVLPMVVP